MPLHESEAIVLQSYPLGEADRLVSFFTRNLGRMRGVASGARRPKSRFGSTLENLSHIRVWFFERETRELVRINQCELIESFLDAGRDYPSGVALALFSEITQEVLPDREPSDAAFRLLLLSAQMVKRTGKPLRPVAYFCLWSVKLAGWLPALERCVRCGKELGAESGYATPLLPGIHCARCRRPGMHTLSAAARQTASLMLSERLDCIAEEKIGAAEAKEMTRFLLDIMEHQIERKLATRQLWETLE